MKTLKINHLAVWLCVILATAIGFLWYGVLFQETWMEMVGLDLAKIEASPAGASIWITNLIATIAPMYALAWFFTKLDIESGIQGAFYAFIIVFCFVFLSRMTSDMFAMNPYGLTWIDGGSNLVVITLAGFILGAWRKYKD